MKKLITTMTNVIDLRDAFAFGGLALVGYGVHAIYPPAAFIVVGAVLMLIGIRR